MTFPGCAILYATLIFRVTLPCNEDLIVGCIAGHLPCALRPVCCCAEWVSSRSSRFHPFLCKCSHTRKCMPTMITITLYYILAQFVATHFSLKVHLKVLKSAWFSPTWKCMNPELTLQLEPDCDHPSDAPLHDDNDSRHQLPATVR